MKIVGNCIKIKIGLKFYLIWKLAFKRYSIKAHSVVCVFFKPYHLVYKSAVGGMAESK